jgi:hypothetical protein
MSRDAASRVRIHALRAAARAAAAALLVGVAGCVTPSVPIPPPEPERIAFALDADAGTATFSYGRSVYQGAVVYVFNRDRGVGVITTAESDGSVAPTAPFAAADGDDVVVTFDRDDQLAAVCVTLHDGPSSSAYECSL